MAAGAIADANANEIKCAIALLDSLEGLPATTVVLCMEGRVAWRVRLSVAGKDRRVSVKKALGRRLECLGIAAAKTCW
jgi:hypothetical protein